MKRLIFAVTALVALTFAVPALAGHNEGCPPHNPNCNQTGGDDPGTSGGNATATAFGGSGFGGTGFGGNSSSSSGVFGSGNSHSSSSASQGQQQGQGQLQGQGQGQIGINDQGQGQDQFGYVATDVTVSDNSVYRTTYDFPVNTAAPVFAGNCAQGVSAQTMSFGGSIASGNSVCDYIAVAGAYIAGGSRDEAFRVLGKAESAADWRFFFSKVRMVITLGLL